MMLQHATRATPSIRAVGFPYRDKIPTSRRSRKSTGFRFCFSKLEYVARRLPYASARPERQVGGVQQKRHDLPRKRRHRTRTWRLEESNSGASARRGVGPFFRRIPSSGSTTNHTRGANKKKKPDRRYHMRGPPFFLHALRTQNGRLPGKRPCMPRSIFAMPPFDIFFIIFCIC